MEIKEFGLQPGSVVCVSLLHSSRREYIGQIVFLSEEVGTPFLFSCMQV